MPDQEAIEHQLQLLAAYRQTLMQYLKQQAMIGMVYIQPGVAQGIRESRANIRRIKGILKGWGVNVDNWPDDEELPGEVSTQPIIVPVPSTSSIWLLY